MLFYHAALLACLILLFATKAVLASAVKAGDIRRVRVLLYFRLGLALTGCSYLLHILFTPLTGLLLLASIVVCFTGTLCIYIGFLEQGSLLSERKQTRSVSAEFEEPGLPRINDQARRVLQSAREEAHSLRQVSVDTDHLLLGLLCEPRCTGSQVLDRLNVRQWNIRRALGQPRNKIRYPAAPDVADSLPLTERARQVFVLAMQEAHRFDKTSVGTEHILLGLVLMGTGAAASALFREGVTVDGIRAELLRKTAA